MKSNRIIIIVIHYYYLKSILLLVIVMARTAVQKQSGSFMTKIRNKNYSFKEFYLCYYTPRVRNVSHFQFFVALWIS